MIIDFSEDEQADYLLSRGYMICVRVEIREVNIYQNIFIDHAEVIVEAIKNNKTNSLESAFVTEFKQALINI